MVSSLGLSSITVTSPAPCLELRPRRVFTEDTEDSLDGGDWGGSWWRLSRPNDFLKLSQRNLETEFLLACSYSELPSCCWMYRIFSSPEGGGNVCTRWPDSPWCGEWCWWCGDWAPIVPANTSLPLLQFRVSLPHNQNIHIFYSFDILSDGQNWAPVVHYIYWRREHGSRPRNFDNVGTSTFCLQYHSNIEEYLLLCLLFHPDLIHFNKICYLQNFLSALTPHVLSVVHCASIIANLDHWFASGY